MIDGGYEHYKVAEPKHLTAKQSNVVHSDESRVVSDRWQNLPWA